MKCYLESTFEVREPDRFLRGRFAPAYRNDHIMTLLGVNARLSLSRHVTPDLDGIVDHSKVGIHPIPA